MIIRNQKGFALAVCLALLPCLIAGLLMAYSGFGFVRNDLALKYHCRNEGIQGQKQVAPLLKALLALNTVAKTLQLQKGKALLDLTAAIAAVNPVAIAKASAHLAKINERKQTLDKHQKELIKQSNLLLKRSHFSGALLIRRTSSEISNFFLKTDLTDLNGSPPKLAVHPDSSDIAPTYSLDDDFEHKQSLAHQWQYQTEVRPPFSNFISGTFKFKKTCAVTLKEDGSKWIPKITADKLSLKSVW